jgi:hypothetical protein
MQQYHFAVLLKSGRHGDIEYQCLSIKREIHLTTKWYQRIILPQRALPLAASPGVIYLLQEVTNMVSAISARDNVNFIMVF